VEPLVGLVKIQKIKGVGTAEEIAGGLTDRIKAKACEEVWKDLRAENSKLRFPFAQKANEAEWRD